MTQAQYQTPGVYVVEQDGFSSSIVEVPTAVPVFIGYTEYAKNGSQDLTNVPLPISSMAEFLQYFAAPGSAANGAPVPLFTYTTTPGATPPYICATTNLRFNLYYSMLLFFNNGGGNCYIMSIGSYAHANANGVSKDDYASCWSVLARYAEPTIVVMPDAMLLSMADWTTVSQQVLMHCNTMQSRIALLDVWHGYLPADRSSSDPIQGATGAGGFYSVNGLGEDFNKYGAAYYPWINTSLVPADAIDYTWITPASLGQLVTDLTAEAPKLFADSPAGRQQLARYQGMLALMAATTGAPDASSTHKSVYAISPIYRQVIAGLATSVNLLPPSGALAGVYTRNDNTFGVFQSPANTTIISAVSPAVNISDADQNNLNTPLNGLAVNAIRTFPNAGLLIWGARTMAGNSDDWRYISVRRTMIMLEQSIKAAMQAYVFQSNDSLTWVAVTSAINNFLNSQWKVGALQGAKPSDAYNVAVGLNSTMTGEDILQGYMRVSVGVAVVRPAEFIMLTFQQQMQTS